MEELINKTLELLDANPEWRDRYSGYLSDIFANNAKNSKGFDKPQGLSLYTTVSDRNSKEYYLRFKGQNVGKVSVNRNGEILLTCLSDYFKECPMSKDETKKWMEAEATQFRAYFRDLSSTIKTKSPEHAVESALLKEFRKSSSKEKAICYIQPVLLHKCCFQMPTPLQASKHNPAYSKQHGGGIDIMARIKTPNWHSRLCVIEIKDENKESESQLDAMKQAVIYATFISKLLQEQPDWWEFFMGHENLSGRNDYRLDKSDIEVVTIMPAPKEDSSTFENEEIFIPQTGTRLHCHSLYYEQDKFNNEQTFEFSGTFLTRVKVKE